MSAPLTRRGLMRSAGTVAVAGAALSLPIAVPAASGHRDWQAAVDLHERAKAAEDAYSKAVAEPADQEYLACKLEMPKFEMPGENGGKPTVWSVTSIAHFAGDDFAKIDQPLTVFARAQMATINRITEHNVRLCERLRIDEIEGEFDRLVDERCDARDALFLVCAPDMAAVAYKLKLLSNDCHLADNDDSDAPLALIRADVERLLAH